MHSAVTDKGRNVAMSEKNVKAHNHRPLTPPPAAHQPQNDKSQKTIATFQPPHRSTARFPILLLSQLSPLIHKPLPAMSSSVSPHQRDIGEVASLRAEGVDRLNPKLSTLNRHRTPPPTAPPLSALSRGRGGHCAIANFTVLSTINSQP